MSVYKVSYRYANSLYQFAEEKKVVEKVAADADLIFNTLSASKELRRVLKNPIIKPEDKKNLIKAVFEQKIDAETKGFVTFVIEKGREDILLEIFREYLNIHDKKVGILRAKITSAVDFNEATRKSILGSLEKKTNKQVVASYLVDPKIIGGFIAEIDDTVYDTSVRQQLKLLRKKFSEEINISNN